MGNTKDSTGRRIFDDRYDFPQDSQDLADDIWENGNVRVGTSAERQSFPPGQTKAGMLWVETDTGSIWQHDGSGWVPPLLTQVGTVVTTSAPETTRQSVSFDFPRAFSAPPTIICTGYVTAGGAQVTTFQNVAATTVSQGSVFYAASTNFSSANQATIMWVAVGPA